MKKYTLLFCSCLLLMAKLATGQNTNCVIVPTISPTDTTVCSGAPVTLTASGGDSYSWSNGDTGSVIIVNPTTDSVFTVNAKSGTCSGSSSDTIRVFPSLLAIVPSNDTICNGQSVALVITNDTTGTNFNWTPAAGLSDIIGDTVVASPTVTTIYSVIGMGVGECTFIGKDTIFVNPAPPLTILPNDTTICSGQSAILYASGGGSNFIWTPTAGLIDTSLSGDSVIASPTLTTTYTVTGIEPNGCPSSGTDIVTVIPSPGTPTFTQVGDTLISSSKYGNQWYRNDTLLVGDTNQYLIITIPGCYFVIVKNEFNGCSTGSDTSLCNAAINQVELNNSIQLFPNPFSTELFIKIDQSAGDLENWSMQLSDVLGRIIYKTQSLNYLNEINMSKMPSGIYFVSIINQTGRAVFPVVKQE